MCSREKGHKGLCNKKRVEDGFWEKSAPRRKHKLSLLNPEIDNVNMDIIQAQSLQDQIAEEKRKFEEEKNNIDIELQSEI